ncbi:MAG: T9SS type A sorting domain-containing protein [Saprospiraceae bacterium]|nr:T9SS type A sorting domain-containing protein [Saprospiraceae bacterium]MBK8623846.1 T9SS type A sorting domain-containing protein [Saprospiraceae bacterium]MBK9994397.1 T9SS type A sorting domain-containing protein [Saprospiraceae bacterium]
MKNLLSLFVLISTFLHLNSQTQKFGAELNPCKLKFTTDVNTPTDWVCHNFIRNQSGQNLELLWEREDVILPTDWESFVCDNNQCYGSFTVKCPLDNPNNLIPSQNMVADVHAYDNAKEGSAYIKLHVFEKADTNSRISVDFLFNKESVGTNSIRNIKMSFYPNPVTNYFQLNYNTGVKKIEIIDPLGKIVKSYETESSKTYDFSALDNGYYLLRIINDEGKMIRTIPIVKTK